MDSNLSNDKIMRYSRQLILPEIGVRGQQKLCDSAVLIVGAGGLGCPVAIYLAAAGVGKIGLVDYDNIELNNLHRQVLHTENRVGSSKSASAATACGQLNSTVQCVPYHVQLNSANAKEIISQYDLVVDATDNVATRYLLNDACVLFGKSLVSGSALRFEGQLTVYNYLGGPCYRCLYPTPPPPATVTNCSDGGVLGVVPGIIGSLQALETIKIITGIGSSYSEKMLLFDGLDTSFRHIKLRSRQPQCAVCGDHPTVTSLIDYEQFCGSKACDKTVNIDVLTNAQRITCKEYKSMLDSNTCHILLDVRQCGEFDVCRLPHSINIELKSLQSSQTKERLITEINRLQKQVKDNVSIVVICKLGNESQRGVLSLSNMLPTWGMDDVCVRDIIGGLTAWADEVDKAFPKY